MLNCPASLDKDRVYYCTYCYSTIRFKRNQLVIDTRAGRFLFGVCKTLTRGVLRKRMSGRHCVAYKAVRVESTCNRSPPAWGTMLGS